MSHTFHPTNINFLRHMFQKIDKDGNGIVSAKELQKALTNGLIYPPFSYDTACLITNMFDRKQTGGIQFEDFGSMVKYIQDWKACFLAFDRDNSGSIDANELSTALINFGYRLSSSVQRLLMNRFFRKGQTVIYFDDFIQCCVILHVLTSLFRFHDKDLDGIITINYEEYLFMLLNCPVRLW